MAFTYAMSIKTARMQAVADAIDAGAGANGTLEIGVSGMGTILATLNLTKPCGSVTNDVLTFNMPVSDASADATGTAAEARIKDADGTIVISGFTVGGAGSGADIILASTSLTSGQPFTINTGTITHAA